MSLHVKQYVSELVILSCVLIIHCQLFLICGNKIQSNIGTGLLATKTIHKIQLKNSTWKSNLMMVINSSQITNTTKGFVDQQGHDQPEQRQLSRPTCEQIELGLGQQLFRTN